MHRASRKMAIGFGVALAVLAGCMEPTVTSRGGFKTEYLAARDALESGRYTAAIRDYESLLPKSGPLQTRVRLEYAHSLLRDNQFSAAAEQARILSGTETGSARAAALAVEGTAEHELALTALKTTPGDKAVIRAHLLGAQTALGTALKDPAKIDPLGTLALRKQQIDQMLASLG